LFAGGSTASQTVASVEARAKRRKPVLVSIHGLAVGPALAVLPFSTWIPGHIPCEVATMGTGVSRRRRLRGPDSSRMSFDLASVAPTIMSE
jgi:ferric-dicitrate binding protein FerR (iron transport regulator)